MFSWLTTPRQCLPLYPTDEYLTHNSLVCLFPALTFAGTLRRNIFSTSKRSEEYIQKYVERGYKEEYPGGTIQQLLGNER